jgi:hypothetical protein
VSPLDFLLDDLRPYDDPVFLADGESDSESDSLPDILFPADLFPPAEVLPDGVSGPSLKRLLSTISDLLKIDRRGSPSATKLRDRKMFRVKFSAAGELIPDQTVLVTAPKLVRRERTSHEQSDLSCWPCCRGHGGTFTHRLALMQFRDQKNGTY